MHLHYPYTPRYYSSLAVVCYGPYCALPLPSLQGTDTDTLLQAPAYPLTRRKLKDRGAARTVSECYILPLQRLFSP